MCILYEDYWSCGNFQMERLTAEVQSVFRELVMQGDWLSSETKVLAESKIQNIVHRFGHSLIFIFDFFKILSGAQYYTHLELFHKNRFTLNT